MVDQSLHQAWITDCGGESCRKFPKEGSRPLDRRGGALLSVCLRCRLRLRRRPSDWPFEGALDGVSGDMDAGDVVALNLREKDRVGIVRGATTRASTRSKAAAITSTRKTRCAAARGGSGLFRFSFPAPFRALKIRNSWPD